MAFDDVSLDDRYALSSGTAILSGMQALARLVLEQAAFDAARGLKTRGYVTGYRGSPVGGFDMEVMRQKQRLDACGAVFQPAVNEDLALTAASGTQQNYMLQDPDLQGVFAFWYGKGPGVDRSMDALRHAVAAGTSPHGGIVLIAGDDPSAKSSSIAHQSELALAAAGAPILFPPSVRDYIPMGLQAVELSRVSGLPVALKIVTDTADSAATLDLGALRPTFAPSPAPPPGRHNQAGVPNFLGQETQVLEDRLPAAMAFARANNINQTIVSPKEKRLGVISCGRAFTETRAAMARLGLGADQGVGLYRLNMVWPLEPQGLKEFYQDYQEVLVIEDKRAFVETHLARLLVNQPNAPILSGKTDPTGAALLSESGELTASAIDAALVRRASANGCNGLQMAANSSANAAAHPISADAVRNAPAPPPRTPWYCAGCPHNRSTKLPEGALAGGGIGCHSLSVLNDSHTHGLFTQMGGEGAFWIGQAPFSTRPHMFQNIGDGTYVHSGYLAIRAAVAAKTSITFKILCNDAVALTGGQSMDGDISPRDIAAQIAAEGVAPIAVLSDDVNAAKAAGPWPAGVAFYDRRETIEVQKKFALEPGVSALLHIQTCAAEKRRRRKRGLMDDPPRRAFINPLVCEGCGDCGLKSNCVAVKPLETPFGLKRQIDQTACNKDFSCIDGFCPSFAVIDGDLDPLITTDGIPHAPPADAPPRPDLADPQDYAVVVVGIGGAGVVTVGAVLAMAARLEGKHVLSLDQTGLSQKNGAVTHHLQINDQPIDDRPARLAPGTAKALIGCDLLTAASDPILSLMRPDAAAVLNTHVEPLAVFARDPMARPDAGALETRIAAQTTVKAALSSADLAERLTGDAMGANLLLVGAACQAGLLCVSPEAIERAIEMNGAAVARNLAAFRWGRWAVADPERLPVASAAALVDPMTAYTAHLTAYQNAAWAERFQRTIRAFQTAAGPGDVADLAAQILFRAMSYKDEYEVARLWAAPETRAALAQRFRSGARVRVLLAPPMFSRRDPATGEPRKRAFGPWVFPLFAGLARLKRLRGTAFDPFGWTSERRLERRFIAEVEQALEGIAKAPASDEARQALAALAEVKGFGPVKQRAYERSAPIWRGALAKLPGL